MKTIKVLTNTMLLATFLATGFSNAADRGGRGNDNDAGRAISKSSQAGLLHEATEHTLRQMVLTNSQIQFQVQEISSRFLDTAQSVEVLVTLQDSSKVRSTCTLFDEVSRGGTVVKKEYRCQIL